MKHLSTIRGTFGLYSIPLKFAQQHVPRLLCPPACTHDPCQEPVIILVVSQRGRRGRRKGTGYFRDAQEFLAIMAGIMEGLKDYDIEQIAAHMRRNNLKTGSDNLDSIVRMLKRHAKNYGVDLPALFAAIHHSNPS
jgi:hypothetical protein